MNSKECLKHICDKCQINAGKIQVACPFRSISNDYCDEYDTIKQDLDQLEKLEVENKELRKAVKSWNESCGKLIRENIKCKRALDILKENKIHLLSLKIASDRDSYNSMNRGLVYDYLTQEEYELLKEVLQYD